MRKALVLVVALVALVSAGDKWLAYGPQALSALPVSSENGIPQVLPPAIWDFPNADTMKYDDNIASNAWCWTLGGNGFGVKFVRPANPVTLAGALINLWPNTWPTPGDSQFQVKVYQADGPNGEPGTVLWESSTLIGHRGGWNYVPVGVDIIDYDYYVFYFQVGDNPNCPGMSIDARYNAPSGTQWDCMSGSFSEGDRPGDWLIRAVLDWTPQSNNVAAMFFGNVPRETIPAVNLMLQATFKNFGTTTVPRGMPAKMRITGPEGYLREWITDTTVGQMTYRGQTMVTFHPNWRTPDTAGTYTIKVWSDLASDEYRANDTIVRTVSVAKWLTYAAWNTPYWITWAGPERATLFHPPDFGVAYPIALSRVRAQFYWHSSYPWDDSIFHYAIYNEIGDSLWASDTIRARHNVPIECPVTPPIILSSGDFYVSTVPRSLQGYPSTLADNVAPGGHSYVGSTSGGWSPWSMGEFFVSVSGRTYTSAIKDYVSCYGPAKLSIRAVPNPGERPVIAWQIPVAGPLQIVLYDASGQKVRTVFRSRNTHALAGSLRFDTKSLPDGIYLVKLTATGAAASNKLIVAH